MTSEQMQDQLTNRIGILVLGMHRSGTSALTRVLNFLGCDLPKTLLPSSPDNNEAGFWESSRIVQLNEKIMRSAGLRWDDWLPFNPRWFSSPKAADFRQNAQQVLSEEFGNSSFFVLKEPRLGRFAPLWLEAMERAEVKPHVVIPIRNPLEVAASLQKRDKIDLDWASLMWLRYTLDIERDTRGRLRHFTNYDELLSDWNSVVVGISNKFNLSWPRISVRSKSDIDGFLSKEYRHHFKTEKALADDIFTSAWIKKSYAIYNKWSTQGESQDDYSELDSIRTELDAATPAFAHLIISGREATRRVEALNADLADVRANVSTAKSLVFERDQRLQELERALQEANDSTQKEQDIISSLVNEHNATIDNKNREIEELNKELMNAVEEGKRLRDLLSSSQNELAHRNADTQAELQNLRNERSTFESRITERFDEIAQLTRILRKTERDLTLANEHMTWLREVSSTLMQTASGLKGRLGALMPGPIRFKKQKVSLLRKRIFDSDAYLAANPDVAEAGMDPLWHYINHGMGEGRQLGI